jgi:hypothetical protein
VIYIVLPAFFVVGLLLFPAGLLYHHYGRKRASMAARFLGVPRLIIDFSNADVRTAVTFLAALTIINVLIVSALTYKGSNTPSPQTSARKCATP